jgi:hypothetical protein
MAQAQEPDFVFRRNGRVHLNRRGRQFGRLLAAEVCASEVVMLDTSCSEVVWRVLATHSIRQFPLHFPSLASPCTITVQLDSAESDWGICSWPWQLFAMTKADFILFVTSNWCTPPSPDVLHLKLHYVEVQSVFFVPEIKQLFSVLFSVQRCW